MIFSLIIGFVLGAGAIVFALQNNAIVALSFLGWQFQSSLALVIIIALAAGFLLGMLLSFPSIVRRSLIIRRITKQANGLHDETQTLRTENQELAARLQAETAPSPDTIDLRSTI